MRKLTILLMVLVSSMFLPFSAFAQTDFNSASSSTLNGFEPISPTFTSPTQETVTGLMILPEERVESFTFEKVQDGYTWELDEDGYLYQDWILPASPQGLFLDEEDFEPPETGVFRDHTNVLNEDGSYTMSTHMPYLENEQGEFVPYQLTEDADTVIVEVGGGNFSFDKNAGALTISDSDGVVISSDSYIVRQAPLNTDDWNSLTVNDESIITTVEESSNKSVVTFIRENFEGVFKVEYVISSGTLKTTAYFTNNSFEESKFAFTETIQLPDSIITLNSMEDIDLSNYVGMTVNRQVLEENEDLILQIKDLYYNAGIGFDKLWSVKILDSNTVALDYAKIGETSTAIGETVELDPVYSFVPDNYDRFNIYDSSYGVTGSSCVTPWVKNTGNISTNYLNLPSTSTTNNNCFLPAIDFDISSIPSTATITGVSMAFDISSSTNPINCNYIGIDATNASSASDIYTDITSTGVTMLSNDSTCAGAVSNDNVVNFGSVGASELQSDLTSGNFVVGIEPVSSTRTGVTVEQHFKNQVLAVTYTAPPSEPANLSGTFLSPNVDLSWTPGNANSEYITSSIAKYYNPSVGVGAPATWSLWLGGAAPTTPTTGADGVLGNSMDFNGSTDMIGNDQVTGFPNSGVQPTQGSISMWIKPEATGSSVGNPFGGTGFESYWITNTPLWSAYPSNSFNMGSLYSNANAYNMQQWNHLVVAIDSTTSSNITTVYVNGSVVPMFDYPSGTGGGSSNNQNSKTAGNLLANTILGGQYHPNPQFKYPFDGKIDEFSSYNKVLSQSDVTALYNSGLGNTPDGASSDLILASDTSHTQYWLTYSQQTTCDETVITNSTSSSYVLVSGGQQSSLYCTYLLMGYDVSDIPDNATITNVVLEHSADGNAGGAFNKVITPITKNPATATDQEMATDIGDGTPYATVTTAMPYYDNIVDLGTGADSNLSALVASGDDTWYFGVKPETRPNNNTQDNYVFFGSYENKLTISYTANGVNNNLITYFDLNDTSFPIHNKAVTTSPDPVTYAVTNTETGDLDSFDTSTEVGFSTSGNTITKDSGSSGWGDSKIKSAQTFYAPFSFDFSPSASGTAGYIGLGQGTLLATTSGQQQFPDSMKFGYFISGESKVVEYDDTFTAKNIQASFNPSDNYRIAVEADGTVKYYRQASGTGAFNLEYTSANTANGAYYLQSNMHSNGQGFVDIKYDGSVYIASTTNANYATTANLGEISNYSILASTSAGSSGGSNTANLNLSFPNSPTGLTVTLNNNNMDLSWTAPSIPNGSILGYKVETSTDNVNWSTLVADTGNTNTTYTDTSPTMGSLNYYKVSAINTYGTGDSNVVFVTPSVDTTITLPASTYPSGVATDSSGNMYVALSSLNQIAVYNSSGVLQNTYGAGGAISCTNSAVNFGNPQGIAVDSSGNIWVAEHSCHRVQKLDSSGNHLFYMGNTPTGAQGYTTAGFSYPYDVDFDTSGNLFVVDAGNEQISKFDSSGNFISQFLSLPSTGQGNYEAIGLWAIAIDSDDDVYIADRYNNRVSHYDSSGTYIDSLGVSSGTGGSTNALLNNPMGVAVDSHNNVYVADTNNQRVQKFDSSGTYVMSTPTSSAYYNSVAIDNSYNIHVVSDERNAEIYSQIGTNVSEMAGTLPAAPTNLAATTADPIVLTWTASPDPDAASPVLHYSIERSTDGTNWTTLSANVGNVVTYTDNTTTAGTIYHYQVSAVTNAGAGPASTPTSASAGTVSTPPQTLAVTQTTVGQLDLSWAAPADDGSTGGITGYKIYRDGSVIATLGNTLTYNDATIAAGTQYTYTVTALNAVGESTVSNGIVITSWAVPDAPTGATASGGIPIVINWNAPNSDRPITDYKVYRDGSLVATVTAPALTYSDSNVTPNTTYSYTVSAVSAVGEGAQSTSTSGQSGVPPAQITTFTATPVDSSRIKLDWTAPNDNGYAITGYNIYQGGSLVGTTAGLTYTDTGLQNNTTYSYTVTAVNVGGEGTQSAAQTATTATPLSPPTNVYTEEHVTSVTVTWDKVIGAVSYTVERDGVTLGTTTDFWYVDSTAAASTSYSYKVYANSSAVNGLNGTTGAVTTASATSHQYITVTPTAPNANAYPIDMYELHRNGAMVGYLEPNNLVYEDHDISIGTTYTYQVRAHNLLGWSQLSPVGSVTTWNVPDVITTLSGTTGSPIILNWTAPNSDKPITIYTIYRDGNLLATTANLTYSDASVAAGTTYVYTATATSIIGQGVQSAGISLQAGTVPTVPQSVSVTAQAGNSILFSWQAPSNNGGVPVTGYNPQVSTDGGTTWTDLWTSPATSLSATHTGLVTGQNYSYQVTAINAVGNSPYTTAVSVISGDVPAQVTGLSTAAVSDTEIDLTWNVPANNSYSISSYNILRSTDGTTWTALTSSTNSYSDTGLTADTNYAYKVSAVNVLGTGAESSTVQQRTFGLPDPVTSITLTPQSETQINLSWTQPNLNGFSLVGYTVQQSTDSGVTWTTLSTQTSTTYSATALTQNTIYDYRINTENAFGSVDGTSNTATTYPFASNLISGVTQSDTEIQVTWNAIAGNGAVQYSLERSADSGVTWTPATIYITSTTYTDTGLTPLSGYNYRVTSVNSAGLSSPSISSNTVTTFGPSEAPTNLALTALLNAEIKLDWSAPTVNNGGPVTGYNIERSTDGTTWSVVTNNVSGLTYTDTGLTTSQVYYYKVSAVNAYGISAFSASANAMASDVPSQVTGLTATPLTNYEIQLDWTAPNSNGYPISGYTIERSTDAGTTWAVLVADTQNTNVTYTDINLTVSQTYDYKISAINQVGTGTASTAANAQAGDVPDSPVLTLTALPNNVIQSDWTSPTNNGFAITSYQLERSDDGGVTWNAVTSVNANTFQNTGLTNSVSYQYKVSATNQVGVSAFSTAVTMIAGDVPGTVNPLTATTTSNTSIDLAWTAPNTNGYVVSGYMIERSTDGGTTWNTLVADTQNTSLSYSDTGLTTGTIYTYQVSAINQLGTGVVSATANSHAGDVPGIPVMTLTALPNNAIQLDWTVPATNGFAITTYAVERSTDGINWSPLVAINANTYQDTGLTNSATYYYKVTAVNQIGNSAFSAPASVIAGDVPSQVTGLTTTTTSNTSIDFAWTAPNDNGYAVSGYMIERSTDNGVTWTTLVADTQSSATAYSNTGLTTGTYYTYKISAINSLGTGPASATSTSHAGGVPDATVLTATPSASGQIILSWTVPGDNGFALDKYLVERSTDGITYASIASIVPSTGVTTHTDTGVVGTLYYYKVTVENAIGFSPDSNIESLNAGDVPGVVTNLAGTTQSDTQLNLTWNAAAPNGYPVTGYMIEQSVDNITWTAIEPDTQNTQTTYNVLGLTNSSDYYYRVSAINSIGTGSLSNTVQLHTFGPPDAIGAVTSTATNNSATLSWTTPYSHGSPVTGYKIEVKDFNSGNWLNLATVTTTTYTQINMIPNTQYEYRITAINPYGTSYSPNTVVSTLATASGTPTVTVISGTEIKVEWTAVAGTGITYTIYTSPDDITYTAGPVGHPTAYFDHQGLANGQTVYYKVSVLNSSGGSAQSPSAFGTTYTTPDAPTNIQITHNTPLSATITWTAPANDGGDPNNLSYTLQRSNDNANWMSLQATAGLTATDSPLTPGSQYYWRVNSLNSAGIGGTSGTVSYLAPDVPTAPGSLTAALTGSNNNAAVLNWLAPSNTSGYSVIGYHIEVNENSGGWTTLVQDTGNSGLVYTNTGLSAGSSYVYRVSAITAVGEGVPSNTSTVNPILISLSITGTPTGGNSVSITPTITASGTSSAIIVQQALYRDNARVDLVSLNIPLTSGASLPTMIDYPTRTSSYVMTIVLDTGFVIQSQTNPTLSLTPSAPFTGSISFSEDRLEYDTPTECAAAGGVGALAWDPNADVAVNDMASKCPISYTESVLEFTVQPVGAEVIITYQPQNINDDAIIKAFTATTNAISETTIVDKEIDYYASVIVNPQFEYTKNADGTIALICDPNDIMCDPTDQDGDPTNGIQSQIPKGVPSEKTFKSFKSPSATSQLGIEPMGNLFGINMVFIFVIAVAGIFTGRSAPMGVVFIVITLGIMAYLGYLDFGSDVMSVATWALLIISAILGIFLGKRWS